jgi:hypothetical protein
MQIVTAEAVRRMPLVAVLLDVAMRMEPEAARSWPKSQALLT